MEWRINGKKVNQKERKRNSKMKGNEEQRKSADKVKMERLKIEEDNKPDMV